MTSLELIKILDELFPDAKCELVYHNLYELTVAVILSAQTTDKSVNKVTPNLFKKYPDFSSLKRASIEEVKECIKSLGLAQNKAKNLINLANIIDNDYNSNIPNSFDELIKLPGIGRKTANVILLEGFEIPALAVDTHVERVSKRLGLASINSNVEQVEEELKQFFPEEYWHHVHHLLIFFGRYFCSARNPKCEECPFKNNCHK